ncbi:conserved hypothetical protein [Gammaproteobacteria bacterium]
MIEFSDSISRHALILHPDNPLASVAVADLNLALRMQGILGDPLFVDATDTPSAVGWYAAGAQLLEQITFLGCSPVIRLAATHDGDTDVCRLRLLPPMAYPIWRAPIDATPPRCPRCRAPDVAWRDALPTWEADPLASRHACPACGHTAPLHQWRLREAAGFGRSFVEFWGIHPGEAVPGESLLACLAQLSNGSWRWFYWSGLIHFGVRL